MVYRDSSRRVDELITEMVLSKKQVFPPYEHGGGGAEAMKWKKNYVSFTTLTRKVKDIIASHKGRQFDPEQFYGELIIDIDDEFTYRPRINLRDLTFLNSQRLNTIIEQGHRRLQNKDKPPVPVHYYDTAYEIIQNELKTVRNKTVWFLKRWFTKTQSDRVNLILAVCLLSYPAPSPTLGHVINAGFYALTRIAKERNLITWLQHKVGSVQVVHQMAASRNRVRPNSINEVLEQLLYSR